MNGFVRILNARRTKELLFDLILGSCPLLGIDELIGWICPKLCACSADQNNSSIHRFTKFGHEPKNLLLITATNTYSWKQKLWYTSSNTHIAYWYRGKRISINKERVSDERPRAGTHRV
jgi:hypothetical protein